MDKTTLQGLLIGLLAVCWIAVVVTLTDNIAQLDIENVIQLTTVLIATVAVIVSVYSAEVNNRWRKSEAYQKNGVELLEKAYASLQKNLGEDGYPRNDRLLWLSCARLITMSAQISRKISTNVHQQTYAAYSAYWRQQFSEMLRFGGEFMSPRGESYFAASPEKFIVYNISDQEPLCETSLAIVYRFVMEKSLILKVDAEFTKEEIKTMKLFTAPSLGKFMEKVNALRNKDEPHN